MYGLLCATFTSYQSAQELTKRFQPCASTLSPTFLLSISLSFYLSTSLPDTSIHPQTHALSVFLSSELTRLVKEHSPLQVQLSGIADSDTLNLLLHLKQLLKPIASDLLTNLRYLLDDVCVSVCACVCVCMWVCMCGQGFYWAALKIFSCI